jgi:hypothetical protein
MFRVLQMVSTTFRPHARPTDDNVDRSEDGLQIAALR